MKFSVSSGDLLKRLQSISGAVSSNPILPIMEDFLFDIKSDKLTISATDLDTSMTTEIDVLSEGDLSTCIPAKMLIDVLKGLPSQPITISVGERNLITITSKNGKYKLAGENSSDFPSIAQRSESALLEMPATELSSIISRTIWATGNDELRQAMTGVYFDISSKDVCFASTDAHKLTRYISSEHKSEKDANFIVPKKALHLLKNALSDGQVKIYFSDKSVFFETANIKLVSRLIDAKYPDYNAVIPAEGSDSLYIIVDRKELLDAVKRVSIFANKTTNGIVFNSTASGLTITAEDFDFANEAAEVVSCEKSDEIRIGFNAKFMIEALSVLSDTSVTIRLSTPTRPAVLYETNTKTDYMVLLMPIMI